MMTQLLSGSALSEMGLQALYLSLTLQPLGHGLEWWLKTRSLESGLGLYPGSALYQLCNRGQVTQPLCVLVPIYKTRVMMVPTSQGC